MSEPPVNRDRSRHIGVKCHFLHDRIHTGDITLLKCAGPHNVADTLTKSLLHFCTFRALLFILIALTYGAPSLPFQPFMLALCLPVCLLLHLANPSLYRFPVVRKLFHFLARACQVVRLWPSLTVRHRVQG